MTYEVEADRLKRIKVDVKSSLIHFLEYYPENHSLTVKYKRVGFLKNAKKCYHEISPQQFFGLLTGESVGKALLKLVNKPHGV